MRRSLPRFVRPRMVNEGRWGVVQPVGHHTVNVDGEGSNPSAPAKFSLLAVLSWPQPPETSLQICLNRDRLVLSNRQPGVQPAFPSAVHRLNVGVAYLLQIFRDQRGAKA